MDSATAIELVRSEARLDDDLRKQIVRTAAFRRWVESTNSAPLAGFIIHDALRLDYRRKALVTSFRSAIRGGGSYERKAVTVSDLVHRAHARKVRQIEGSSLALADFWKRAAEIADAKGYCGVYDALASALGGPRRDNK